MDFNLAVMLRESARRAPAKTAVILGDARLSYAQLDELSDRVAASLAAAGLAPGDRVGLQLPNIPQFVIAYFGILKAGGVVVPMNVLLKAPEIAFQLRELRRQDADHLRRLPRRGGQGGRGGGGDVAVRRRPRPAPPARRHAPSRPCWPATRPARSWPRAARPTRR